VPALIITGYAFNLPRDDLDRFEFSVEPVRPSELCKPSTDAPNREH